MSTNTSKNTFSLKCPNCKKKLKFANQGLLGKKVKCPGCKQPFLLTLPKEVAEEPILTGNPKADPAFKPPVEPSSAPRIDKEEEVKLELVNDELPVGTSAVWVPDSPILAAEKPSSPVQETQPHAESTPLFTEPTQQGGAPIIAPIATDSSENNPGSYRSRRKKSWGPTIIVGVFLLLGIGTVGYLVVNQKPKKVASESSTGGTVQEELEEPVNENEPYSRERLSYGPQLVAEFEPTSGKPLDLAMMPRGVSFIIHIRPALLWSSQREYQVLKASLTDDVTNWIAAKLKEVCRRDPEQIEEAYLGFILGAGGSEPEVCAVVHLKEPAKLSDLIDEFKGEYVYDITERPDLRLKRDDKYAYLIKDESTIAIAPRLYASELEESLTRAFVLSVPMENLLRETDQQRLLTVMGVVRDLRLHAPMLMPESSQVAFDQFLEWIGEDVEAVSWSVHPEPYLHSQLIIHPSSASNPAVLSKRIEKQMAELPQALWKNVCLKMSPKEMRFRNFIGRLPAMLEAFHQSTISSTTANFLSLTTVLPAKAAPNLALATMFTVNEAARTDFTADVVVAVKSGPKLPETVKERLSIPVDSEFNRRPLEMALQYLAGEIEVTMKVDGDALKDAGYTKNMPQTFKLGVVPVEQSFAKIVNNYQEAGKIMVMSIDEKTKTIHITTEKFAKRKNLPIYVFK